MNPGSPRPSHRPLAVVCALASIGVIRCGNRLTVGSPSETGMQADASNEGGPADGLTSGRCPGFAPAVSWPIPRPALRLQEQGDASAAIDLHATVDFDGDERPDFVVTYDVDGSPNDLWWTLYRNTGMGFDSMPVRWPIPRPALRLDEQGDASTASYLHATFDMDGDLRPDFVVTYDPSGAAGDHLWLVYRNNGSGFDSTPIRWSVPLRAFRLQEQGDPSGAFELFTTIDVDGDRRPDLLVTYDRSAPLPGVGTTWFVYHNTGSGFASSPEAWSVPLRAFVANAQGDPATASSLYALLDMDGDERPDFVETYDLSGAAGDGVWLVHRNTGHGFADPPVRWTIPGRALHLSEQGDASAVLRLWTTTPRVRRGAQDFLVTFDRTTGAGDTEWLRYENTGSGFATMPTAWTIPIRAFQLDEQGDASAAFALHASEDLDGDRAFDFVMTYQLGTSVGRTEWRLFRACAP